jgi:predicted nucleotidyltransferase
MGKILTPEKPDFANPGKPKPSKIKATVVFQDANYTFMRNKEQLTTEDVFNLPLHLILIALGMIDAHTYVPRFGKDSYLKTIKRLKKQFDDHYKAQKAIATGMKDGKK